MHFQLQLIDRVMALAPPVGVLFAIFSCVVALTAMADQPSGQDPRPSADARMLAEPTRRSLADIHLAGTSTAPGRRSLSIAMRDHRRSRDRFAARSAVAITPVGLDRSFDLRADLMDMAISMRWHRGPESNLPPGSD
jgi:hypothetical protein